MLPASTSVASSRPLAEAVAAVAVANKVGLAREIKGLAGSGAGEHVEGAGVEVVLGAHRCAGVDLAPQSIEARRQPRAIRQASFHRRVEIQARDLELRRGGIAIDDERGVGGAEVGGTEAEGVDMLPPRIDQRRVAGDAGDGGRAEAGDKRPGHREVVDEPGRLLWGPAG